MFRDVFSEIERRWQGQLRWWRECKTVLPALLHIFTLGLKLGLKQSDLVHQYGLHQSTVSRITSVFNSRNL